MEEGRFDGMLLQLAQQHRGIEEVLTTFMGFLRRKTDFFVGQKTEGQAEKVVIKVVREQAALAERAAAERKKRLAKQQLEADARKAAKAKKRAEAMAAAAGGSSSTAAPDGDDDDDDIPTLSGTSASPSLPKASPAVTTTPVEKFQKPKATADSAEAEAEAEAGDDAADADDESKGAAPSAGNGGSGPHYDWTQTLSDLVINVHVPLGTKGKHIIVDVTKTYIKVGRKGEPLLLDGKLHKPCRPEELIWTVDDNDDDTGRIVSIEVPKKNQMEWWKCIVEGDPVIDTSKVEPENSKLSDLDRDTRQTVEKMMFDQRQKAMNKPTSDEMKKNEMLKKFMDQHPEMDFSNAKVQ